MLPQLRYGTGAGDGDHGGCGAGRERGAIFPATLRLERATLEVDGWVIRLAPGMNLTAEIKTGRRRVIDYLLSPVSESLRER